MTKLFQTLKQAIVRETRIVEVLTDRDPISPEQLERHAQELLRLIQRVKQEMSGRANPPPDVDGCHRDEDRVHETADALHVNSHSPPFPWDEAIDRLQNRIRDLEQLQAHQEATQLSSDEARGQILAFVRVLDWLESERAKSQLH